MKLIFTKHFKERLKQRFKSEAKVVAGIVVEKLKAEIKKLVRDLVEVGEAELLIRFNGEVVKVPLAADLKENAVVLKTIIRLNGKWL